MSKTDRTSTKPTRSIERRDFLNGVAWTAGSLLMPKASLGQAAGPDSSSQEYFLEHGINEQDPRYYPPALTGMRGNHPGSFEVAHQLRDEHGFHGDQTVQDTHEEYDLVIVGGGISGLSAAWFYRRQRPQAKILILDNHDDFGGHAKRNEFHSGGKLQIGYGGTQSIEGWGSYSPEARQLLQALGIEIQRFEKYYDNRFESRFGLGHCEFFAREAFGEDRFLSGYGKPDWKTYLARTPLSAQAREDLRRIQEDRVDYLRGMSIEQKQSLLQKISFKDFLIRYCKVDPQVVRYFQSTTHGGFASGIDAINALEVIFLGLKGEHLEFLGGPTAALAQGLGLSTRGFFDQQYIYHFPDGNASIARLLVRSLIPPVAPGNTMEDIVTARFDYAQLDNPRAPVRIRLNSTVVRATNVGVPGKLTGTEVTYLRAGKAHKVSGKACILACWNGVIPYVCPELPERQKTALSYGVKAPLTYTNVQIRNWQAIRAAGLRTSYCPGSFFSEVYLDFPVSIGDYHYTSAPDQPAVLHLVRVPTAPGLPIREQFRAGRAELYATGFEVFERNVHDQLGRMFGSFGFDPHRDIEAITVNRWSHGYAYTYQVMWDGEEPAEGRPNVIGRQRYGRIAIANSDAGADAETQTAIAEGHRAVHELLEAFGHA